MRAATSARSSSRIRSVRSTVSCHTHGPTTRSSAPATAPGARKPPLAPRRPRKITAPAISSATPTRGSEPPGRSDPPAASNGDQTRDEQRRPEQRRSRQAEREKNRGRRHREQGRRRQRPPAPRVDPQCEIEEDAGPAGESEDREDQPHEGRVDGESCCDAAAHARDNAVVGAALEEQRAQRSASTNDGDLPEPDGRVDHVAAPSAGLHDRVPPRILPAEHVHVSQLRPRIDLNGNTSGGRRSAARRRRPWRSRSTVSGRAGSPTGRSSDSPRRAGRTARLRLRSTASRHGRRLRRRG